MAKRILLISLHVYSWRSTLSMILLHWWSPVAFNKGFFSTIPHPLFSSVPLITYSSVPHRLCECEPSDELQRTNDDRASSQGEQEQEYTHPCSQGWSEETLLDISIYTTTSAEQTHSIGKYQNNYKISKYHVSTFIFYFIQEIMNKFNKFQKKIYIWLYNNKYEFCKYLEICMNYFVKVVFLKVRVLIKLNCCKGVWAWHSWAMLMLRRVILWAADTRLWKFKVWNLRMCI